jgi:hypothetical protein
VIWILDNTEINGFINIHESEFIGRCDKDLAIIFTAGSLTSTLLAMEWELMTANAAGPNGLTSLSKHEGARYKFGHPSNDRPTLLNFRDRTLSSYRGYQAPLILHTNFFIFLPFLFPKWGRYNMFSSCCNKGSANFLYDRPPARVQPLPEVGTNDCKCSWDQRLNVPSEVRRTSR